MKAKIVLKSIFLFILVLILIGLLYIIFTKSGNDNGVNVFKLVDYVIEDRTETCNEKLELIYSSKGKKYYLPCEKSEYVFLKWDDGVVDSLKNAIDKEKVTMDSLMEHGLEIIVNDK